MDAFQSIGLDFAAASGAGGPAPVMASGTVAGIVPQANWNSSLAVTQATPVALVDHAGLPSGATASWTGATNGWTLPIATSPGDFQMMKGYLERNTGSGTITLTFTNIPYALYDIYVYADGEGFGTRQGTYSYQATGSGSSSWTDPPTTEFNGAYLLGQNYVRFTDVSGANLQLFATVTNLRAPINGVQIVAVPEPATLGFLVLAGAGAGAAGWKRRQERRLAEPLTSH